MAKTKYRLLETESFINPYNFVPVRLGAADRIKLERDPEDSLTGVLKCSLIPRTPLIIPETEYYYADGEVEGHKRYNFFSYRDGRPAVPGSTIRGALRNVYETVTNSCFVNAKSEAVITMRTANPFSAAMLIRENGVWCLYPAERLLLDRDGVRNAGNCGIKFGEAVSVKAKKDERSKRSERKVTEIKPFSEHDEQSGYIKGYFFPGEKFSTKKYESVFRIKGEKKNISSAEMEKLADRLTEVYIAYNENSDGHPYKGYEDALRRGTVPVWYKEESDRSIKLSLACIGRYGLRKTWGEMIGSKAACRARSNVCRACALFGMASDENIGSRVRISDAVTVSGADSYEKAAVIPEELAGPKISFMPFYLNKPGGSGKYSYDSMEIRGRKYYWHSDKTETTREKNKRNSTMETLIPKDGLRLSFNIFFDGITRRQLDELIWTVCIGENRADGRLCYKIGHAKPRGFGSVKMTVDEVCIRSLENGYSIISEAVGECSDIEFSDKTAAEQLKLIMDIEAVRGERVTYPYVKAAEDIDKSKIKVTELASLKWFAKTYRLGAKKPEQYLPGIADIAQKTESGSLMPYELCMDDGNNGSGSYKSGVNRGGNYKGSGKKVYSTDKNGGSHKGGNNAFDLLFASQDKIYTAVVGKIDRNTKFIPITLEDGTKGTLDKKYNVKQGDKLNVVLKDYKRKIYKPEKQ